MTLEKLEERRKAIGTLVYNVQYQQEPIPYEGNLIKRSWFEHFEGMPPREFFDAIVQSWDTASEAGELNDYSVCMTWGIKGENLYLLDVFREKLEFPNLLRSTKTLALNYRANVVLIENMGNGSSLRQRLHASLNARIIKVSPKQDKIMRLMNVSYLFENGTIKLPRDAPWLASFEKELLGFPGGRHDDQVDSVTQALDWIKRHNVGRLQYPLDGRHKRPSPRRRKSGSRQPRSGLRSVPVKIF